MSTPIKIELPPKAPEKVSGSFVPKNLDFITVSVDGMQTPRRLDISVSGKVKIDKTKQ